MTLSEQVEKKLNELSPEDAAAYFETTPANIKSVKKTHRIPLKWAEKVHAEHQKDAPPPISDDERIAKIEAAANNANVGVQQIVNHFNTSVAPEIGKLQSAQANTALAVQGLADKVERLLQSRPQGVAHAPTLGQLVNAQPFERDPQVSLTRPAATTLATFTEGTPNNANPLDTGIAPSKEQVEEQNRIRASGGDPATQGTNRPAGPATQPASANYADWTKPAIRR